MGSYAPESRDPQSEDFDAVVSYLAAVSRRLSPAELLDIADTLHELIRRRKRRPPLYRAEARSFTSSASRVSGDRRIRRSGGACALALTETSDPA